MAAAPVTQRPPAPAGGAGAGAVSPEVVLNEPGVLAMSSADVRTAVQADTTVSTKHV